MKGKKGAWLGLLAAMAFVLLAYGCGKEEDDPVSLIEEADKLIEGVATDASRGLNNIADRAEAEKLYDRALRADPPGNAEEARYVRAHGNLGLGLARTFDLVNMIMGLTNTEALAGSNAGGCEAMMDLKPLMPIFRTLVDTALNPLLENYRLAIDNMTATKEGNCDRYCLALSNAALYFGDRNVPDPMRLDLSGHYDRNGALITYGALKLFLSVVELLFSYNDVPATLIMLLLNPMAGWDLNGIMNEPSRLATFLNSNPCFGNPLLDPSFGVLTATGAGAIPYVQSLMADAVRAFYTAFWVMDVNDIDPANTFPKDKFLFKLLDGLIDRCTFSMEDNQLIGVLTGDEQVAEMMNFLVDASSGLYTSLTGKKIDKSARPVVETDCDPNNPGDCIFDAIKYLYPLLSSLMASIDVTALLNMTPPQDCPEPPTTAVGANLDMAMIAKLIDNPYELGLPAIDLKQVFINPIADIKGMFPEFSETDGKKFPEDGVPYPAWVSGQTFDRGAFFMDFIETTRRGSLPAPGDSKHQWPTMDFEDEPNDVTDVAYVFMSNADFNGVFLRTSAVKDDNGNLVPTYYRRPSFTNGRFNALLSRVADLLKMFL